MHFALIRFNCRGQEQHGTTWNNMEQHLEQQKQHLEQHGTTWNNMEQHLEQHGTTFGTTKTTFGTTLRQHWAAGVHLLKESLYNSIYIRIP